MGDPLVGESEYIRESEYILAGTEPDTESVRLALLENCYDPCTIRRLESLAVAPGSRCLEVGAGRGSIARWLSAAVGPGGTVVAADIDCRFLTDLPGNVEVRRLDIRADELEPDSYDLVHCRALLNHLPDPLAALRRMAAALRPGGVLIAEEADAALLGYSGHPEAESATEATHRAFTGLASAKVGNFYLGRDLARLLGEAGLDVFGGDVDGSVSRLGDPVFEWWRMSMDGMAPGLISYGLLTADDAARLQRVSGGSDSVLTMFAAVSAWGRRVR